MSPAFGVGNKVVVVNRGQRGFVFGFGGSVVLVNAPARQAGQLLTVGVHHIPIVIVVVFLGDEEGVTLLHGLVVGFFLLLKRQVGVLGHFALPGVHKTRQDGDRYVK